jgi:multiple sugar transport system permease protein
MAITTPAPVSAAPQERQRGRGWGRGPSTDPAVSRAGIGTALLFVGPYLVLFGTFVLAPIVYGLWISLHQWDFLLPGKPFVGLQNYVDLFTPGSTTSEDFWNSMNS